MIEFNRTGGASQSNSTNGNGRSDLPRAQLWMNIGYSVTTGEGEDAQTRFVSLPMGIPLDTMKDITITSRNEEFARFQAHQNKLLSSVQAKAAALKPGEECIIGDTGGLQIQLRRVNDAPSAPSLSAEDPLAMPFQL